MSLTRLTKIAGPGIKTDTNWVGNNANFTGVTTAGSSFNIGVTTIHSTLIEAHNIKSTGIITATGGSFSGNVTAVDGTFSGNVSIAGTLTYEDLTNIDSVGLVTARDGIFIPDNKEVKIGNTASNPDIKIFHQSSSNHSFIDNTTGNLYIRGGGQVISLQATNVAHSVQCNPNSWVKLYNAGSEKLSTTSKGITVGTGVTIETSGQANFAGITTISGGDLVVKPSAFPGVSSRIKLGYAEQLQFTVSSANQVVMRSTGAYLQIASNTLNISRGDMNLHMATFKAGREIELTHNYVNRLVTSGVGVTVYNQLDTTNLSIAGVSTFTGNIDANGDLDVDGHTNLDNVNIAGVTTSTGNIYADNYFGNGGLTLNNNGNPSLNLTSTSTTGSSRINFGDPDSGSVGKIYYAHNGDYIHFNTAYNERLRIGSAGQIGIAGANYGTSGQALVSQGSGSSVAWQTITGTTINNNADNRVITGSGSANTLNGESNVQIDSGGRLSVGNSQASTQYDQSNDLVIGNTTGSHGMTIISANDNRGRIMFSDTYSANTGRYAGQMLYDHQTETINWYSNYTNNGNVAMQLGGDEHQLFVGIDKGSTATYNNRSAFFHRASSNFLSITTNSDQVAGIVFGDTIANNTANYESYMYHNNSTNDFWIRVNQGNDNRHLKITQAGNVEIGNGNLVMASGHGIDFSASSHASGQTSELFDDYEEGSWTPNYSRPNMTLTYGYREGYYTKIGRTVHVVGRLYTTSESGGSTGGPILVTGLPFTVRGVRCALSLRPSQWSNDHPSFATFELNQTHFELLEEVEGNPSGSQDLGGGRFAGGNGNYLWFSGSYITDT